ADGVGLGRHVHPLELGDEVLVLLLGAHEADRLARRDDHVVLDEEAAGSAVDVDPTGQVLAVEHGDKAVVGLLLLGGERRDDGEDEQAGGEPAETSHGEISCQELGRGCASTQPPARLCNPFGVGWGWLLIPGVREYATPGYWMQPLRGKD